ncbi:MAG: 50S ribosomal protein L7Ae [Candidatus Aenigmatarchaeota archaeon]
MSYVKFDVPDELNDTVLEAVEVARATGKIGIGTNESTKDIERGDADLVVIAEDVQPPEIVMHLAPLCEEKDIPYVYTKSKDELGRVCGIDVQSASVSIKEAGDSEDLIKEIIREVEKLK